MLDSAPVSRRSMIAKVVGAVAISACAGASDDADLHATLVGQYLRGEWDELTSTLRARAKQFAALSPAQKADVDYVRRAVAECRPEWWAECKAGRLVRFRPNVWGRTLSAVFDPSIKTNISITYITGGAVVSVKWDAADMDDPTIAGELEFTKGEHVDVELWTTLGSAQSLTLLSPREQIGLDAAGRTRLTRYLNFRGNVAGAYYATPRARRLALWQAISGWSHEYDKAGMFMPMRAIGILFAAEVLGHPELYPSVKWPAEPPAEGAESKMIWELQEWIRHHELPLKEDRAFREALKAFATLNEAKARQTGIVTLPNRLTLSLDPQADEMLSAQRDAWIKERYAKTPEHP